MIFYLSGTGNTKWAATTIAQATGEELINILDIRDEGTPWRLKENERIGFCFPVHGWRPPVVMREFIKKLDISEPSGHYVFALCTAGDNIGEAIDILRDDLSSIGIHLDSAFSLIMPESYVGLPFMDVDTPVKEKKKKENAAEVIKIAIKSITNDEKGVNELTIGRWPRINSRLIGGFFTKHLITDKPFRVSGDRCIGCGLCAKSCPTGNIVLDLQKQPVWKHDKSCLACFSCYHHCPTHAIEFGRMTKNKGQYFYK